MKKEGMKTILMLVIVAAVLVTLTFAVKAVLTMQYDSQDQPQLAGSVSGSGSTAQPDAPNIRSANPTPSSCTATQNCGSPTCAAAQGTGGCGCGG